jgi:hypothetical protein
VSVGGAHVRGGGGPQGGGKILLKVLGTITKDLWQVAPGHPEHNVRHMCHIKTPPTRQRASWSSNTDFSLALALRLFSHGAALSLFNPSSTIWQEKQAMDQPHRLHPLRNYKKKSQQLIHALWEPDLSSMREPVEFSISKKVYMFSWHIQWYCENRVENWVSILRPAQHWFLQDFATSIWRQ